MERVIDVTLARRQFGTLLDEVYYKRDIITIERKGKALAKLVPLDQVDEQLLLDNTMGAKEKILLDELNSLPRIGIEQDPVEELRKIRKKKRINARNKYGK